MENRSKKLIKNTAILSFGTICTKGIMFLMTPLFTRWLSKSDYGTFDLIITYISLLIPIITLDCGEAVFRLLLDKNEENKHKKVVTNAIIIDSIAFMISLVITIIIGLIYSKIRTLLIYFLLLLVLESINTLMIMIIRGIKKLNIYTIANILFVVMMTISVTIFVKVLNMQLNGILLGYIVGYIVSTIFMFLKGNVQEYISIKYFDKKVAKEMLKYSFPLIPNALSWWVVNVSDRTIVSMILGTSTNAVLAVANKIPNLCQTLFNVFHLSWQENASETIADKDIEQYYNNVMNTMIKILISICVVILSANFLIFNYLFDKEYFEAYYQVPILILAIIISMLTQFIGDIYIARKESGKNGKTTVIAAVSNLIIHISLIKFIGIYAATISTLISYIILFIIRYIDIRKSINIKFDKTSYKNFIIFIYFFVSAYINNEYLNIANLIIAIIYFIFNNKQIINKIIYKFMHKNG